MSFRHIRRSVRYGVGARVVNAALARAVSVASVFASVIVAGVVLAGTRPAAADPTVILALGDSLTAGYGLEQEDAFPVKLEAALRARGLEVTVINGGVSGDTSAGGLTRLDWALAASPGGMPDAMILELGANDGLRGLDPEATEENLDAIIRKAKAEGVEVLLTGMLAPPNLGREYGDDFKALFPDLAEKHGVAFYPFFLDGVAADPALNQEDGIHPNPKGVDIIVERILPYVERLIGGD